MTEYQPGVCNIGRDEQRKRRATGAVSLVGALGVVAYGIATGRPPTFALLAAPLFVGAALGFVQDRLRFCVGFGALARYDLSGSGGDAGSVAEAEAVRRDRRRAVTVLALSVALGVLGTALAYGASTAL